MLQRWDCRPLLTSWSLLGPSSCPEGEGHPSGVGHLRAVAPAGCSKHRGAGACQVRKPARHVKQVFTACSSLRKAEMLPLVLLVSL